MTLVVAAAAHCALLGFSPHAARAGRPESPEASHWLEVSADDGAGALGTSAAARAATDARGRHEPLPSTATSRLTRRQRHATARTAPPVQHESTPSAASGDGEVLGPGRTDHGAGSGRLSAVAGALKARLVDQSGCLGLFPRSAQDDNGTVTVLLDVQSSGRALLRRIVAESPAGQGFADAAGRCAPRLKFTPARDEAGQPLASTSVVRLRFARLD